MDIFAQKKLLIRLVTILIAMNLFLIGFFVWKEIFHKPPPPGRFDELRDVSEILKKELNLNETQAEQIKVIREDFFAKEKLLEATIRSGRDSMNIEMYSKNSNEEMIKSIARRTVENEYKMELLRYEQSQKLKSICTPDQMEKFNKLILEIRDYFKPEDKPKKF